MAKQGGQLWLGIATAIGFSAFGAYHFGLIERFAPEFLEPQTKSSSSKQSAAPSVVVTPVIMQQINDQVEALGTLKANESILISSKVTERVTQVHFQDGQQVEKGQLLITLQSSEQQARLTRAEVDLAEHQRELNRVDALVRQQILASSEQDKLRTLVATANAELVAAQAAVEERQIIAPFAGRLGLREVSDGSLVTPTMSLTTLDDIAKVKLDFTVPEHLVAVLTLGSAIEARAAAYPDQIFIGEVIGIDSRIDPVTRAVTIRAIIDNPNHQLLPGMLMQTEVISQPRMASMIPEAAIIPKQNTHSVYVVHQDQIVEKQIKLGLRKKGWVEVRTGLEVGEQVVTRGMMRVRPGMQVSTLTEENFGAAIAQPKTPVNSVGGAV